MNATVITVCNQKGGAGKTTVAMHLAGYLGFKFKVLVVDADPQGSAMQWFSSAGDDNPYLATVISLSQIGKKVHQSIKRFIPDYDFIIVDCPPSDNSPIPKSALLVSDLAIIPVRPSPLDLWATVGIIKTIEDVKIINETLTARLLLNQCQHNFKITEEILDVLPELKIKILESKINLRTVYSTSAGIGVTVHNNKEKNDKKAKKEIKNFAEEVCNIFKN